MVEVVRCAWATSDQLYLDYHDHEWGRPVHGDDKVYERVTLEAFQSGLAWITILRKRENFRRAFDGFVIEKVAAYTEKDVERLMADAGIVRNRAKVDAAIANARAALELPEGLSALVWKYAEPDSPVRRTMADIPSSTVNSQALAKELKKKGFRFVGPTTAYALMQAIGLVNDHIEGCIARR
ncbi:DNA-3-methyladenine glycosylase I [Herbidospora sp. NEAU-GS84]|uniref:DNA-3-methyladenine glycosylase I n=1 Tax=Herbidospora solisilvae TaxID=2696284 RepID=A0A7C9P343_9ACTN|nr:MULTISPECIES: DNA-3-methyladenine glycosylase I [Herbidospora]NAS27237.1 DNA-3-methyladenine glycosylase I [Herbidospora solisilvae]GLX98962.1 DNA-3-methyladenine glycosylase I [Herbidospora sp. NBRC 101105]